MATLWAGMGFIDESLKLMARGHADIGDDEAESDVRLALLGNPSKPPE